MDDIAFNHLIAGNIENAVSIWEKKENASSLQNRIVCALIQGDYNATIACAHKLYSSYISDFAHIVLGDSLTTGTEQLEYNFLDSLCSAIGSQQLLPYLPDGNWKQHISDLSVKPLIESIQSAINIAKASKGKGITARYNAGVKLMNETKATLVQLKSMLSVSDLQYQMLADKLGLELLQCGIDYYNGSEAADAAYKAMKLQSYALSVVVGRMAKDRCKENVDILQKIIQNLPPAEVFAEDKAIKEELRKFCQLPDKICHAVTLLNNTKPQLQSIKAKLGSANVFYLKVSTQVVGNALHNIIEEVNDAQADQTITQIIVVLQEAWRATRIMDTFDLESDFKIRYDQNRSILKKLRDQLEVHTFISKTTAINSLSSYQSSRPTSQRPTSSYSHSTSSSNKSSTSSSNEGLSGCLIAFIAWIAIGCIAGGICTAYDSDFAVGFAISGVIAIVLLIFLLINN